MTAAPTDPAPALVVENLGKRFAALWAVRELGFEVRTGLTGFLGPNGAGKSTTFRMLAGSLGPTTGTVRVLGHDLSARPRQAKQLIGYMPEAAPLYPEMTVREYLEFRAQLRGLPRAARRSSVERNLERTRTSDVHATVIGHLSKGYRQRVALADALLGDPPLLLLDEPTAGLDPNQVMEVRELLVELSRDHALLLSTHVLSEVEAICERALVIHQGRLVAEGTLDELRSQARKDALEEVFRSLTRGVTTQPRDAADPEPEART